VDRQGCWTELGKVIARCADHLRRNLVEFGTKVLAICEVANEAINDGAM